MKKLLTLTFIFILSLSVFATPVYVFNQSQYEIVNQAYATRPSFDSYWSSDLIFSEIYPNQYDGFVTNYFNCYYDFKVVTKSGKSCIVRKYVTQTPLAISVYDNSCLITEYSR